jgi:hypothetical protein
MKLHLLLLLITLWFAINSYSQTSKEDFDRGLSKYKLQDNSGAISDYTKVVEMTMMN